MQSSSPAETQLATPSNQGTMTGDASAQRNATVVFLKESNADDGDAAFVPLFHHHSITLRDLAEEYNISSVLECDANGAVQPRAVAFDSPSDVLHSGRHYIVRRDAKGEDGANRVTFRGKILVKEYDLDGHGGTPSSCASHSATPAPATPYHSNTTLAEATLSQEEGASQVRAPPGVGVGMTWQPDAARSGAGDETDKENAPASSSVGAVKRHREEGDHSSMDHGVGVVPRDETGSTSVLADSTNARRDGGGAGKANGQRLRYLPFQADLHGTGSDAAVRLEDLAALCADVGTLEEAYSKRHEEAEQVFESARRVLFATSKQQ